MGALWTSAGGAARKLSDRLFPTGGGPQAAAIHPWSLDRPLLRFAGQDAWTIRDACAGTLIFGDTGSGKTTGSGQAIAMAMLRAGFGGLVLTVKAGETDRWREYARRCGRENDLIVFSPERPHRFNFLEYEYRRSTRGGGSTENIVELFVTVMNASSASQGSASNEAYWDRALRQLLRNMLDALRLAGDPLTLSNMRSLLVSAPMAREQVSDPEWRRDSYLFRTLERASDRSSTESGQHTLRLTADYWLSEFAETMDPRTRGNIVSTFTTTVDGFMRGDLHELFGTSLNITPELTLDGKIIVLDLPEKQFHDLGRTAQLVWKLCWQRAVEESERDQRSRPVMLWADEAQRFVTVKEPGFVQTVREHKGCCVYLTQARSNYLHAMGPGNQAAVESFLGVPKTKIFHCNGDPETNEWAQRIISEDWRTRASYNLAEPDGRTPRVRDADSKRSTGFSRSREPRIHASVFGILGCGGPPDFVVQAILFQSGRRFAAGEGNTIRLSFSQGDPSR
ncbi:MAG: hypothetical protein AAFQ71_11675 [Planctomycetota bacterium]